MAAIAETTGKLKKVCKGCGAEKFLNEFNTHHKNKDGREGKCRKCRNHRFISNYIRKHKNDPRHQDLPIERQPRVIDTTPYKVGDPWFIFDN